MTRLVVVGDCLLDRDVLGTVERVSPDTGVPVLAQTDVVSRPGGAGLAALLSARAGESVVLVTALSSDLAGRELRSLLDAAGVEVHDLGLDGATPEKVRLHGPSPLLRLDRGGATGAVGTAGSQVRWLATRADAVLVADYGRGVATACRTHLDGLPTPLVWDPHPRGGPPVQGATLVTPNDGEARAATGLAGDSLTAVTARAESLLERWGARAAAVTLGPRGALLLAAGAGTPALVPAPLTAARDTCGAGDAFASAAALALARSALVSEAVAAGVQAASAYVDAGGPAGLRAQAPPPEQAAGAEALVRQVRAAGGTVVAAGGCFDQLHAGHVGLLQDARRLGDALIVCLNSDASVRALKGDGRPLVSQRDRAAVLLGLACVDAVAAFDEATPVPLLERLRPDVFVKGGDYDARTLPEAAALARWGGQCVTLPYLSGRSTTALVTSARAAAQAARPTSGGTA